MAAFLSKGVSTRTHANSRSSWNIWSTYLATLPGYCCSFDFLDNLSSVEDKALRVSLFVKYLFEEKQLRKPRIMSIMSDISRLFSLSLRPTSPFDHGFVHRAKAATKHPQLEARSRALLRDATEKLPVPGEAVWRARSVFFVNQPWTAPGMVEKAKWIALALSYHNGARVSNVTRQDGRSAHDHCILARHIVFYILVEGLPVAVVGGSPLRDKLGCSGSNLATVSSCRVNLVTSKTVRGSFEVARNSACESMVLDDLCLWVIKSGVECNDELVTRYPPPGKSGWRRKTLTNREYQTVFRWLEREVGVPKNSFSSKSCRLAYATGGELDGLSRREINQGGGWARQSQVSGRVYTSQHIVQRGRAAREVDSGKALGAWARAGPLGQGALTIRDVQMMGEHRRAATVDLELLNGNSNIGGV